MSVAFATGHAQAWAAVAAVLLVGGVAVTAAAHAILIESSPRSGQVLDEAPTRVVMRFNSRIVPSLSRVVLVGPSRRQIPLAAAASGAAASGPDRLVLGLPPLGSGTYEVQWRALANDGHVSSGTFFFTVRPSR